MNPQFSARSLQIQRECFVLIVMCMMYECMYEDFPLQKVADYFVSEKDGIATTLRFVTRVTL